MIGYPEILRGGLLPALVAMATLALVWRGTGKAASAWRTALLVGYVAGHWALDARTIPLATALAKSFRATEARDWLPMLMLLAVVPDALACIGKRGPALGWVLRAALCVFVPWRLLRGSAYIPLNVLPDFDFAELDWGAFSTGEMLSWFVGIGAALLLSWSLARHVTSTGNPLVSTTLAVVVALGGAVVAALSDSLVYGQLFGVFAAALAGCSVASLVLRTGRGPGAAAGPLFVGFGSLLLVGHFFASLTLLNAALLLVAMALAVGWLPPLARLAPKGQNVCRALLCLGALATAVTLAGIDFAGSSAEAESNPYQGYQP